MLNRRHRFHGYGSLKSVYSRGKTVRGPLMSLKYGSRDPSRSYRVAVVVSRKVSKSAVVRNRIRRRIYEAVRLEAETIRSGTDLIFLVYSDQVAEMDADKIKRSVKDLLDKAQISSGTV